MKHLNVSSISITQAQNEVFTVFPSSSNISKFSEQSIGYPVAVAQCVGNRQLKQCTVCRMKYSEQYCGLSGLTS